MPVDEGSKFGTDNFKDVYFNMAGFDKETHTYFDTENTVYPVGIQNGLSIQNVEEDYRDVKKISLILPAIGNAVCNLYDAIYGYNPDNENKRYLDTDWLTPEQMRDYDTSLRALKSVGNNGDELDWTPDQLKYLSCAINTVHDLMGMIITAWPAEDANGVPMNIETLDDLLIYYNPSSKAFFRRAKTMGLTELSSVDPVELEFREAENVTADNYLPWIYYIEGETAGTYVPATEAFNTEATYYACYTNAENLPYYSQINFTGLYQPNKYYYHSSDDCYMLSTSDKPTANKEYYKLTLSEPRKEFNYTYADNRYHQATVRSVEITDIEGHTTSQNFIDYNLIQNLDEYDEIINDPVAKQLGAYSLIDTTVMDESRFYVPREYYYRIEDDETTPDIDESGWSLAPDDSDHATEGRIYGIRHDVEGPTYDEEGHPIENPDERDNYYIEEIGPLFDKVLGSFYTKNTFVKMMKQMLI